MLKETTGKLLILCLAAGLAVAAAAVGGESDDGEVIVDKDVKIIVKKLGDCSDEADCEAQRHMVFISEDGESIEIEGDALAWVGGDHGDHARHLRHFGGYHGGGFLGIGLAELTPELRAHFGAPEDAGVMVSRVVDDSPASRAGLQVGDIISAVDGDTVSSGGSLARKIRHHEDGEAATLEVWRDGGFQILTATVEQRQRHRVTAMPGHGARFDCGGGDCDITIDCDDGDCDCLVNGESVDCRELHHGAHLGDD